MSGISFVVPVRNGDIYIRQCLNSILSVAADQDEIIVIDNGSTDRTTQIVSEYGRVNLQVHPDITVSAVRNRGAEAAQNNLLAFIDSDCVLCKGWRDRVISIMGDKRVHSTGALCEVPEHAGWIEKAWFSQKPSKKRVAKYLNTANLIVRKGVFSRLQGFNESLISDEDCEFGERLNKAGYRMIEDPAIRVVHLGNPKTLKAFYLREKWHATSVLASKSLDMLNLPTIMSLLFGLSLVITAVSVVLAVLIDPRLLLLSLLTIMLPLSTAIYRAIKFYKYKQIPALTLLWGIFFMARVGNMASTYLRR